MTLIRVDPLDLLQEAQRLAGISMQLRMLSSRIGEGAASAPSYDGQFAPKVRSMAGEVQGDLQVQIQRLDEQSARLTELAEAFAKADRQSLDGLLAMQQGLIEWLVEVGLLNSDGTLPTGSLLTSLAPGIIAPASPPIGGDDGDEKPPWWGPLAQGIEGVWRWFDRSVGEPLRDMPEVWRGNLYNARIIATRALAQGWFAYDRTVNRFIYDTVDTWRGNLEMLQMIWTQKIWAVQNPGRPSDGPITDTLNTISAADASGVPISIVGADLTQLIDARGGVAVHFSDSLTGGSAGITPFRGLIVLPNKYQRTAVQTSPGSAGLVAHELAHVLQRDHPEFPDGLPPFGSGPMAGFWPFTPEGFQPFNVEYGVPVVGDFTLYMEVQSNLVGLSVEYDMLANELAGLPAGSPQIGAIGARMTQIENHLATYTGPATDAAAYIPQHYGGHGMYVGEMVKELVFGSRIPDGGWQYWLSEQGFSTEAIERIEQIANQGTPKSVRLSGMLDNPNPVPSPTPTLTPTATPSPTPSPTATPSSTPTTSPTPSATPSATPTPSSTPTATEDPSH